MATQTATKNTVSTNSNKTDGVVSLDRRSDDRRSGDPNATDVGVMKNPRRKQNRRRHIDPTTCERDYNDGEIEFMRAMDDYKRDAGRMFPTCSEVLEVVRKLGYVQLTEEQAEQLGLVTEQESFETTRLGDEESCEEEVVGY